MLSKVLCRSLLYISILSIYSFQNNKNYRTKEGCFSEIKEHFSDLSLKNLLEGG